MINEIPLKVEYNNITGKVVEVLGKEIVNKIKVFFTYESDLNFDEDYLVIENAYSKLQIG